MDGYASDDSMAQNGHSTAGSAAVYRTETVMKSRTRVLSFILLTTLLLTVAAACQDQDSPWLFETDSIGFQYAIGGGYTSDQPAVFNSVMGASMSFCPWAGCTPPDDDIAAHTKAHHLPRLFIELGPNDAYADGGWTSLDEVRWLAAIGNLDDDTCAVVVLPYAEPPAYPVDLTELAQARTWMERLPGWFPNVHTIAWETYARRPGVLGPDGLHLAGPPNPDGLAYPGPEALDAYNDMVVAGMSLCR